VKTHSHNLRSVLRDRQLFVNTRYGLLSKKQHKM
jgi:hypothetical protein